MIERGNVVEVHYTGKLTNGEVFDSSRGRDPFKFQVGSGQVIPGFETAILGKNIGDKVTTTLTSDMAYGSIREDLIASVPLDQMPEGIKVGQTLTAESENGKTINVIIKEIKENEVIVDGNHPLANKELIFDIEILSIQVMPNPLPNYND